LAHYAVHAHAAYGWMLDLATRQRLHWGNAHCLMRLVHIHNRSDIVHANWQSRTHRPAYYILRDRQRRAIVLAIRGTWSPQDVLTDLCCSSQETSAFGNDHFLTNWFWPSSRSYRSCHAGMVQAAQAVQQDCQAILAREMQRHPDYTLVLVGHSLGGGCAAILGTLLERDHANLRVYCYGPPGVVPAQVRLHPNIVSVICQGDPVGSWSLGHVADVSTALVRLCQDTVLRDNILWRTSAAPMNPADAKWCHEVLESRLRPIMNGAKLYPPGRILLLMPPNGRRRGIWSRFRRFSWRPPHFRHESNNHGELQEVDATHFRDLVVGPRMMDLSQHVTTRYVSALKALADQSP
jgi:Lipase (class 3)